ncbi:MAG: orotate phosphoribosyltransferase [Gammaproteobacteria bacterium]|nr:MAG: orotate phosphoribosyltransferase [Gammaproteobacteria bacterium]
MKNSTKFIQFAVEQGVLQFGEFTLKSGRISPYFFNAGLFNDGQALDRLSQFYAQAIVDANLDFDMLFGPAYKGIPLVAVVAMTLSRDHGRNYPYAFNRKEVKIHGDGGHIVGAPLSGKILILDDVITAGTAINEAAEIINQAGPMAQVKGVVIAFDRQERSSDQSLSAVQQVERDLNISVTTVAGARELIEYAESNNMYGEHLEALKNYLEKYQSITLQQTRLMFLLGCGPYMTSE